jgi:hypothetical protein
LLQNFRRVNAEGRQISLEGVTHLEKVIAPLWRAVLVKAMDVDFKF